MKPNTRIDNFLAKIAGDPDANTTMKPRSPEEYYLNQIAENGGGGGGTGGVLVVHEDETGTLDKTWQEIYDAMAEGTTVIILLKYPGAFEGEITVVQSIAVCADHAAIDGYYIVAISASLEIGEPSQAIATNFLATSSDGYPVFQPEE